MSGRTITEWSFEERTDRLAAWTPVPDEAAGHQCPKHGTVLKFVGEEESPHDGLRIVWECPLVGCDHVRRALGRAVLLEGKIWPESAYRNVDIIWQRDRFAIERAALRAAVKRPEIVRTSAEFSEAGDRLPVQWRRWDAGGWAEA